MATIVSESSRATFKAKVEEWDDKHSNVHISCWHESLEFTDFMWRVYGQNEHGVAIVTSAQGLLDSFSLVEPKKIGWGFIVYPSPAELIEQRYTEGYHAIPPFLIKTEVFRPESEFRVFVQPKLKVKSCDLDVNLNTLIKEIRISPLAEPWAYEAVRKTLNPICNQLRLPEIAEREHSLRE
ncbi:MAG TPA: DUF2971 domain-containing protein [Roseimicrobium sp.]|nr:DUF2971 domain-containing protein [Roseimicrobium sp.]